MPPNIFKFFKPKKGDPLSKAGVAEFLAASGKAWATLDCLGGEVSWDHGRPMIIPPGSGGVDGLVIDHSFKPTDNGDETFDITQGVVYMGEEDPEVLPGDATDISFATNTHFQVKIDISSTDPVATWEAGTSFTANTATALYFPVLEFGTAGDYSTLIRRQTNDIHYHGDGDIEESFERWWNGTEYVDERPESETSWYLHHSEIIDGDLYLYMHPTGTGDVTEPGDCDQNDHPGDGDYDDDDTHPGDTDDGETHPGDGEADEDDTDHPGYNDCYTTT